MLRRSNRSNKGQFASTRFDDESFLSIINPTQLDPLSYDGRLSYTAELHTCPHTGYLDTLDPRVYLLRNPSLDPDNPTLYEAMNGPHSNEYVAAMKLEIEALERHNTWIVIPRPKDHHVLKSTWAFKLKKLPDGTPSQFKARFYVRGDLQIEGVDFF